MRAIAALGILAAAGCGFDARLGNADARPMTDDAGREIRTWALDAAADFAAPGHEVVGMTVDPRGALTPHGYVYGGLVARGLAGVQLWTPGDADWGTLATVTPGGTGVWTGGALAPTDDLRFAGIPADPAMLTMWFEGELFLDGAVTALRAAGDTTAFAYVALDGVRFEKLAHDATVPITNVPAGWYPIRVGWAAGAAEGRLVLALDVGEGLAAVPRTRLRAPTSAVQGTLRAVYYRQIHGGGVGDRPPVMHVQETALHAATTFEPPLPGSFTTTAVPFDWSARWTGQLYATAAGSYTLRATSADGNALRVGAATAATRYARNDDGAAITEVTAELVEGWNDLVLDYNHVAGAMALDLAITAAPDSALANAPIPRDRLRPVEPRGDRLITASRVPAEAIVIPDNTNTFRFLDVQVQAHPDELVTLVEITAVLRSEDPDELAYRVVAPGGLVLSDPVLVQNAEGGRQIVHYAGTHAAGTPAAGRWRFGVVDDNGGGNSTRYDAVHVTVHTTGGPPQIAEAARWRSPIIEHATAISQLDAIHWDARAPAAATVVVRMRTCDDAACAGDPWSEPIENGTPPVLPAQRYLQLEVEMTSDGTREPELRALTTQYRTDPA